MELPVVVIGAGPQGLAAAAHLLERGIEPLVFEAGQRAAASVSAWGHVRLFSPWPELIDPAGARLLGSTGWNAPKSGYPTGREWIDGYLAPLATALGHRVRTGARVVGVTKKGRDVSVDAGRSEQPFIVHIQDADGGESRREARAVIDASGTWGTPAPAGASGLPALGEGAARNAGRLSHRIPDAAESGSWAGGHVVVIGNGHSAATAIVQLAEVVRATPTTRVSWVLRRGAVGNTFGGGSADELVERGALGTRAHQAVTEGLVTLLTGFRTVQISDAGGRPVVHSEDGRQLEPADQIVVLAGFRPDFSFLSEIRLHLDVRLQAPASVAAEVDPNVHSCGSIQATGAAELAHPDSGFFIVGAKSYGRAPTFLAMTGYEQVRSVVAALAGDTEAAARVDLALPDTGVCGGSGLFDAVQADAGSCCGVPQPVGMGIDPATNN
ncbi:pyridine nucleotide-disulfide oxidoreductase [Leucobacter luti]|uniref:NAD(P)-binding domain-containing protein n=1 Tax=Leucobacter luti TaxID=340320 RepID=UPI001045ABB8|nr:NAD(P)-binding domain-containing protein [Leucobacter luti]MCW2286973.1 thioredoxin reductase [Leucobacter luti]TCK41199.1 pyridine nucleotide-disulfide oxidoreductase [Leucobacter luti]